MIDKRRRSPRHSCGQGGTHANAIAEEKIAAGRITIAGSVRMNRGHLCFLSEEEIAVEEE